MNPLGQTINQIINSRAEVDNRASPPRNYVGGSRLGVPCLRRLQYEARDTLKDEGFSGRTLHIFAVGHMLEEVELKLWKASGFHFRSNDDDGQFGWADCDDKLKGHVDGIIDGGPLELPYPLLWECKSANDNSFKKVQKAGVEGWGKSEYWAQIHVYMGYMGLDHCLYNVVNKNTSERYVELIEFRPDVAQCYIDRGVCLLKSLDDGTDFRREANNADSFKCKWCDYRRRCWNLDVE